MSVAVASALDRIASVARTPTGAGRSYVPASAFFPCPCRPLPRTVVPWTPDGLMRSRVRLVEVSALTPTQPRIILSAVRGYARDLSSPMAGRLGESPLGTVGALPAVLPDGDALYVMDGHSRLAARIARGQAVVAVQLAEAEETPPISPALLARYVAGLDWYQGGQVGDIWIRAIRASTSELPVLAESLASRRVLDVGCNAGFFVREAARRGAEAWGIDADQAAVEQALVLNEYLCSTARCVYVDVMRLSGWAESAQGFDDVLLMSVLHHLPRPNLALDQIAAITRGRLVIEALCWWEGCTATPWHKLPDVAAVDGRRGFPTEACILAALSERFKHARKIGQSAKQKDRQLFEATR